MGPVVYRAIGPHDADIIKRMLRAAGLSPESRALETWQGWLTYPIAVAESEAFAAYRILQEYAECQEQALRPLFKPLRRAVLVGLAAGALVGLLSAWFARDPGLTGIGTGACVALLTACTLFVLQSRSPKPLIDPVCPHCGYSLVRLTVPRCPECGAHFGTALFAVRRATKLKQRRRRAAK
jgi:hypothetical protein